MNIPQTIAIYALPVIFAITLHEAAHAYAAKYFGDATAYLAGRMTLNPLKHIDPFGTILMPLALFWISSGTFAFGYAKPVPVDFNQLRNPKKQMAWVALAGPAANFAMALGWMVFGILLLVGNVTEPFLHAVARAGVLANVVMFVFNLMPIPPLDGGRIVTSMLPGPLAYKFAQIEPFGFFIVLGLVSFHVLDVVLVRCMALTEFVLTKIVSPLLFLLN